MSGLFFDKRGLTPFLIRLLESSFTSSYSQCSSVLHLFAVHFFVEKDWCVKLSKCQLRFVS